MIDTNLSLSEKIYLSIKEDILKGVYDLNKKISMEDLIDRFHVSKMPIREAMTRLESDGMISIVPRVGYFIAPITLKYFHDIFEMRIILETASAKLAAERITEESLCEIESMNASYVSGDSNTYLPWIKYNREFHFRIALSTNNNILAEEIVRTLDHMQRVNWIRLELFPSAQETLVSHQKIIKALRERNANATAEAILEDINNSKEASLNGILAHPELWLI
jgi:DNA-binding GntR family transcriptional regulator